MSCLAQRIVISSTKSICRLVTIGIFLVSVLGPVLFSVINDLDNERQGAPLASLLVTQSWEEWLIHQKVVLPSRGASVG